MMEMKPGHHECVCVFAAVLTDITRSLFYHKMLMSWLRERDREEYEDGEEE